MSVLGIGLSVVGVLGAVLNIGLVVWGWSIARGLSHLRKVHVDGERSQWPRVSIVVAVCDEAQTIEAALGSLLSLDYPSLEIVAVNDRSRDDTGQILDRLAAMDDRLRVVHIESLATGWLGSLNAMKRGKEAAAGEWLLFTDADVHLAPGCICRAITLAESEELDYLGALPQVMPRTFWVQACVGLLGLFFILGARPDRARELDKTSHVGVGAFNLVRRSALEQSLGFDWLRMEIAHDMGIGLMLKKAGARGILVYGLGCIAVEWYPSLSAMVRGLEKTSFAAAGFSWFRVWMVILGVLLVFLGPLLLLVPPIQSWQIALIVLQLGGMIFLGEKMRQWAGIWWLSSLFLYLAWPICLFILWNSARKVSRTGGVTWRGHFYPIEELREGRRLAF